MAAMLLTALQVSVTELLCSQYITARSPSKWIKTSGTYDHMQQKSIDTLFGFQPSFLLSRVMENIFPMGFTSDRTKHKSTAWKQPFSLLLFVDSEASDADDILSEDFSSVVLCTLLPVLSSSL